MEAGKPASSSSTGYGVWGTGSPAVTVGASSMVTVKMERGAGSVPAAPATATATAAAAAVPVVPAVAVAVPRAKRFLATTKARYQPVEIRPELAENPDTPALAEVDRARLSLDRGIQLKAKDGFLDYASLDACLSALSSFAAIHGGKIPFYFKRRITTEAHQALQAFAGIVRVPDPKSEFEIIQLMRAYVDSLGPNLSDVLAKVPKFKPCAAGVAVNEAAGIMVITHVFANIRAAVRKANVKTRDSDSAVADITARLYECLPKEVYDRILFRCGITAGPKPTVPDAITLDNIEDAAIDAVKVVYKDYPSTAATLFHAPLPSTTTAAPRTSSQTAAAPAAAGTKRPADGPSPAAPEHTRGRPRLDAGVAPQHKCPNCKEDHPPGDGICRPLCRFHAERRCKFGSACFFKHA